MVLSKPGNQNVLKAFELTGKVAAVTGKGITRLFVILSAELIYQTQAVLVESDLKSHAR